MAIELKTIQINYIVNYVRTGVLERDFGVADGKGRTIGAAAFLGEAERTLESKQMWANEERPVKPAGRVYGFTPSSHRAGSHFGAAQSTQWFDTPGERDAAVARYFVNAEKRAKKNSA